MDEEKEFKKLLHDANQIRRKLDLLLAEGQRQKERLKNIESQVTAHKRHKPSKTQKLSL